MRAAALITLTSLIGSPSRKAAADSEGFWRAGRDVPPAGDGALSVPHVGIFEDPAGDTIGTEEVQHDVIFVRAEHTDTHLLIRVELAGPIVPIPPELNPEDPFDPRILIGAIEIDADQDPATGGERPLDQFCPPSGLGFDFGISVGGAVGPLGPQQGPGFVVFDPGGNVLATGPVLYEDSAFSLEVPLSALGNDDGLMDIHLAVGTIPEPTDCVPDGGVVTTRRARAVPLLGPAGVAVLGLVLIAGATLLLRRRGEPRASTA